MVRRQLLLRQLIWGWQGDLLFFLQATFLTLRTSYTCSIHCMSCCDAFFFILLTFQGSTFQTCYYLVVIWLRSTFIVGVTSLINQILDLLEYSIFFLYYMRNMRWTVLQQLQGILHQGNRFFTYLIAAPYVMEKNDRIFACSGVDVYTALAGAVGALYGPLHGGANEVCE